MVKDNKKQKEEKELFKLTQEHISILIGILVLVALFIVFYYLFAGSGKVVYENLTFIKTKYGEIPLYQYTYHYDSNGKLYTYNFYVRGNPAENKVPVTGEIVFPPLKTVFITMNPTEFDKCNSSTSTLAMAGLAQFLANNQFTIRIGVPDLQVANSSNRSYITCDNRQNNTVIFVKEGSETKIVRNNLCYNIEVNNCEILPALEKFEIQAIVDAKRSQTK